MRLSRRFRVGGLLFGVRNGRSPPEGTARAEVFCVYHDSMELLGAGRPSPLMVSFGGARKTHAINSPCRPIFFKRILLLLIFFGVRFDCRNWFRRSWAVAVEYASRWSIAKQFHLLGEGAYFLSFSFSRSPFRVPLRDSSLLLCASSLYSSPADFCGGERRILSLRRRNHLVDDVD